jgi:metal-responsive CopG/Arc/MetJ family transcriptional regulator
MASTKTAISIEKSFLDQIDDLSEKLNISRSRFFALAAEEFIKRHKAQELIKAINDAYDEPDQDEQIVFKKMQRNLKKLVKEKWC